MNIEQLRKELEEAIKIGSDDDAKVLRTELSELNYIEKEFTLTSPRLRAAFNSARHQLQMARNRMAAKHMLCNNLVVSLVRLTPVQAAKVSDKLQELQEALDKLQQEASGIVYKEGDIEVRSVGQDTYQLGHTRDATWSFKFGGALTTESLLSILIDRVQRLNHKQPSKEVEEALSHLDGARHWLEKAPKV